MKNVKDKGHRRVKVYIPSIALARAAGVIRKAQTAIWRYKRDCVVVQGRHITQGDFADVIPCQQRAEPVVIGCKSRIAQKLTGTNDLIRETNKIRNGALRNRRCCRRGVRVGVGVEVCTGVAVGCCCGSRRRRSPGTL